MLANKEANPIILQTLNERMCLWASEPAVDTKDNSGPCLLIRRSGGLLHKKQALFVGFRDPGRDRIATWPAKRIHVQLTRGPCELVSTH